MNKILNKIRNREGFTLVEMLVAIAIFMIFTGVIISSYIGIVRSLRGAEEYRELYSGARHVFDTVLDNARNSTIYPKKWSDCNGHMDPYAISSIGSSANPLQIAPDSFEFCAKDGLSKVKFSYDSVAQKVSMEKLTRSSSTEEFTMGGAEAFHADKIKVTDIHFYPTPLVDPFDMNSKSNNYYQPKVTVVATFEMTNSEGGKYDLTLQTSVSLRTYN